MRLKVIELNSSSVLPPRLRRARLPQAVALALAALCATPAVAQTAATPPVAAPVPPPPPVIIALPGNTLHLKSQTELSDPLTRKGEDVPIIGIGDKISGTTDTDTVLEGNAELRQGGSSIKADKIHLFQIEDELFATGAVRVYRDGNVYTGPELRIKLDDYTGYFVAPDYQFSKTQGRGSADRINFLSRQQDELFNPVYTTCRPGNYDWYMHADSIFIDQDSEEGTARNGVIYFKGVPILASPYLTFPLSDARKSGFLPPTFSASSTSGFETILPYYWNIAPNRDLTLYPELLTRRGVQLGGDFRYLEPSYSGDFRYETLADRVTGTERTSLAWINNWVGTGAFAGFSSTINVNHVSDNNYFVDFSKTIAASSTRTLVRDGELSYSTDYWTVTGRVQRYQTLEDSANSILKPYDKLPELVGHAARLDVGGFDFNLDTAITRFSLAGAEGGDRFFIDPSVSYPIIGPGWFVTPKVSYSATHYNLTDVAAGTPTQFDRALPTVSLDSGLIFERDTSLFGTNFRQTLEPRFFYVRTPYKNQNDLPDFDSGVPDFNFDQLFLENTFTGHDRIANANWVTAAVTTRYLNPDSGDELFRASLGQRYYLSQQLVTVPVGSASEFGTSPVGSNQSDVIAAATGHVSRNFSIDTGVEYSPASGGVSQADISGRWNPAPGELVNVGYHYLRDQLYQTEFSGQWPVSRGWAAVGRLNYDTRDHKVVEALGGLEYTGCCWVVRFAAQHFVTGLSTSTTTFFVQLELNGFSKIGSNPLDTLSRNIPGYRPAGIPLPTASPFDTYE